MSEQWMRIAVGIGIIAIAVMLLSRKRYPGQPRVGGMEVFGAGLFAFGIVHVSFPMESRAGSVLSLVALAIAVVGATRMRFARRTGDRRS
jgi:hypothetical protein